MTDNLHSARVEAAAEGMWNRYGSVGMFAHASEVLREAFKRDARTALNAADKLVTVEKIAEVIEGRIMDGWDDALEVAADIHALLTGEEA